MEAGSTRARVPPSTWAMFITKQGQAWENTVTLLKLVTCCGSWCCPRFSPLSSKARGGRCDVGPTTVPCGSGLWSLPLPTLWLHSCHGRDASLLTSVQVDSAWAAGWADLVGTWQWCWQNERVTFSIRLGSSGGNHGRIPSFSPCRDILNNWGNAAQSICGLLLARHFS